MSPINQRPDKEFDAKTPANETELVPVSAEQTFVTDAEINEAIENQSKLPKKPKVAPWRAGPIQEADTSSRWVRGLKIVAFVAQISGAFYTGYAGARKFFETTGLSEMSWWEIGHAAWQGVRRVVGLAT